MKIYRIIDFDHALKHHHIQYQIMDILKDGECTHLTLVLKTSRFHTDSIRVFRTSNQCFHVQICSFDFRFKKSSSAFNFTVKYIEEFMRRSRDGFVESSTVINNLINKGYLADIPLNNKIGRRADYKVKE